MEWIIIIAIIVIGVAFLASSQSNKNESLKKTKSTFDEFEAAGIRIPGDDAYYPHDEMEEQREKLIDIGVQALTLDEVSKEERADIINGVIDSLDENFPDESEKTQVEIIQRAYDKLYQRYSLTKDVDAIAFISAKLDDINTKTEVTTADFADIIEFVDGKKPVKQFIQVVYSSDEEIEKKQVFEKYLEQYKDYSVDQLELLINENKKENYSDYTLEYKQKYRAMKTLIENKSKK